MPPNDLIPILDTTLASIKPGGEYTPTGYLYSLGLRESEPIHDDTFHQLRVLFPESLVLAAFDIVDRKNGTLMVLL